MSNKPYIEGVHYHTDAAGREHQGPGDGFDSAVKKNLLLHAVQ